MAFEKVPELSLSGALADATISFPEGVFAAPVPLIFRPNQMQYLMVQNPAAATGVLTVTVKGDKASAAFNCPGTGKTHDLSTGFTFTVKAGEVQGVCLRQIQAYLVGAVTVTAAGDSADRAGGVVVS